MNYWALDKDLAIKKLLLLLEHEFLADNWQVDDGEQLSATAIVLRSRQETRMSAQISTLGHPHERYDIHLEFPFVSASPGPACDFEELNVRQTLNLLAIHLELTPLAQPLSAAKLFS